MSRNQPQANPALILIIIVSMLMIISLVKNAIGLYQSRNRLESVQSNVAQLESEKSALEKNIQLQSDPISLNQIIRDKLNLALPGEIVIAITGTISATPPPSPPSPRYPPPPILQWWHLFINRK
jgi:cell division protein FtsB